MKPENRENEEHDNNQENTNQKKRDDTSQGISLNTYIMSRKLSASYRFLVSSQKRDISTAISIAGYSDQPSFTKAFKKKYGVSPAVAFQQKDFTKITAPVTWEMLSGSVDSQDLDMQENEELKDNTVFGVSESSFNKLMAILELERFKESLVMSIMIR